MKKPYRSRGGGGAVISNMTPCRVGGMVCTNNRVATGLIDQNYQDKIRTILSKISGVF